MAIKLFKKFAIKILQNLIFKNSNEILKKINNVQENFLEFQLLIECLIELIQLLKKS